MKLINSIKHHLRKFLINSNKNLAQNDIVTYKTKAWQGETAGSYYAKVVDKYIFQELILPIFHAYLVRPTSILEIGCGTGRLTTELIQAGHNVMATDVSMSMLNQLSEGKNLEKKIVDAHQLPFQNASFDAVVSLEFISHFPTWKSLLGEQLRVLKPGGKMIFSYLTAENYLEPKSKFQKNANITIAASENASLISLDELSQLCTEQQAQVENIHPYGIFWGNDIYSGFMGRKKAKDISLEFYNRFNNDQSFRQAVVSLDRKISQLNDPSISARAVAVLTKDY